MNGIVLPDTRTLEFTVYGSPAPQGSKRHVGKGIMVESSAKVKPWRLGVMWEAQDRCDRQGGRPAHFLGAVSASLVFTLPKPRSAPKRDRSWPSKRPDIDKLARSTLDGLTEAGVWLDDAQVVELYLAKKFPNEGAFALDRPGVHVVISEVRA